MPRLNDRFANPAPWAPPSFHPHSHRASTSHAGAARPCRMEGPDIVPVSPGVAAARAAARAAQLELRREAAAQVRVCVVCVCVCVCRGGGGGRGVAVA